MTKNSTATSKWGSSTLASITPVHHLIHSAGFRTAIIEMPAGAYKDDAEHEKLTEIGLGLQGFRGIRSSIKHERFFIDFASSLDNTQITNLVTNMLTQMSIGTHEAPTAPQRALQKNTVPSVQFSRRR